MFFVEFGNPASLVFTSIRYLCIRWSVLTFVICIMQLYTEKRSGVPTQFTCRENEKEEANFFFSFSVQVVCVFYKPLWDNLLVTRETYSLLFTLQSKVLLWPMTLLGMFTAQQVSENIPFLTYSWPWWKSPLIAVPLQLTKIGFREEIFRTHRYSCVCKENPTFNSVFYFWVSSSAGSTQN